MSAPAASPSAGSSTTSAVQGDLPHLSNGPHLTAPSRGLRHAWVPYFDDGMLFTSRLRTLFMPASARAIIFLAPISAFDQVSRPAIPASAAHTRPVSRGRSAHEQDRRFAPVIRSDMREQAPPARPPHPPAQQGAFSSHSVDACLKLHEKTDLLQQKMEAGIRVKKLCAVLFFPCLVASSPSSITSYGDRVVRLTLPSSCVTTSCRRTRTRKPPSTSVPTFSRRTARTMHPSGRSSLYVTSFRISTMGATSNAAVVTPHPSTTPLLSCVSRTASSVQAC